MSYKTELELQDNEVAAKLNTETGEIKTVSKKINNIPHGKSKLDYEDFGMINIEMLKILKKELTHLELSIVLIMISKADFNSNSLKPLNDETSIRTLSKEFNISVNSVPKVIASLRDKGVFATFRITEDEPKEYWILNPYIFWKGRLKEDSIFARFQKTKIVKLLD